MGDYEHRNDEVPLQTLRTLMDSPGSGSTGEEMGVSEAKALREVQKPVLGYGAQTVASTHLCECGCGKFTNIIRETDRSKGLIAGNPRRFIVGHSSAKARTTQSRIIVVDGAECRTIPLTYGKEAIVDLFDYERIALHRWRATKKYDTWYAIRSTFVDGVRGCVEMQREVLCFPLGMMIDHKNHDGLDNRRCNIRECTSTQNQQNKAKYRNNTSGYKGVRRDPRDHSKWRAEIRVNKKCYMLGRFTTPREAALAYDTAARQYHGEFAVTNFPEGTK